MTEYLFAALLALCVVAGLLGLVRGIRIDRRARAHQREIDEMLREVREYQERHYPRPRR
jgi:hypothetical protein